MSESKTFNLGLVMAGAISAGAYTAGVIDFLIEALDAWQAAKDRGEPGVPRHNVCVRVVSGASAGGMTAAMLASLAGREIEHVRSLEPQGDPDNPLYNAWVRRIDLHRLLALNDLDGGAPLHSLLDATALDDIGREAFTVLRPRSQPRKYFCEGLKVMLSVANLRGVPYRIRFAGTDDGHGIMLHKDFVQFIVDPSGEPDFGYVLRSDDINPESWQKLMLAALASGAFPLGLRPRLLDRKAGEYAKWRWTFPPLESGQMVDRDGDGKPDEDEVRPSWELEPESDYRFCCLDGGLMDNEPLELARRELIARVGPTSHKGDKAHWAVVMVDPFPEPPAFDPTYDRPEGEMLDPLRVMWQMFVGLRNQARFKVDELLLANQDNVYSRYMIAPVRHEHRGHEWERAVPASACGGMGAFGGFLDRAFRDHDYQLGRRNAQQFLRRHFVVWENNPIVQDWAMSADAEPYFVRKPDDSYETDRGPDGAERRLLPVIPLMPHLRQEIPSPPWPQYDRGKLEDLRPKLRKRLVRIASAFMAQRGVPWYTRYATMALVRLKADSFTDRILRGVDAALVRHKQLQPHT